MNLPTHPKSVSTIKRISVSSQGLINKALPRIDYSDAFLGQYQSTSKHTIETIAQLFFNASPAWSRKLLTIRNILVGWVGLKTRSIPANKETEIKLIIGQKIGLFRLFDCTENELLFGEDDKHLDVRMILKNDDHAITITTLIQFKNLWGKLYFKIVRVFHQQIMKSQLKKVMTQLNAG